MDLIKRIPFIFLLPALLTFSISCSSSKDTSEQIEIDQKKPEEDKIMDKFLSLAKEKFDDKFSFQLNSEKSYILCFTKPHLTDNQLSTQYFLYDLNNEKIIFEEDIGQGSVKWISEHHIQVIPIPGIVKGDEKTEGSASGYIYDIKQKKKLFNSDLEFDEDQKLD